MPSSLSADHATSQYLTGALVNDTVALDAGPLGLFGTPAEQARVRHVFLSHTHVDHLLSLPIFLENVYHGRSDCVTLHASRAVVESLQRDLFNDRLWPDFFALSRDNAPFLRVEHLEPGETVEVDGLRVTAVPLDHVVPTVGFLIADAGGTIGWVSDTGPTDEIWRRCNEDERLRAVFLELAFPNTMAELAAVSRHLTTALFAREVAKLKRPVRVYAVHVKARYREQVVAELAELGLPDVEPARFGVAYEF
jgi:ribonuclease BN (tRNA processing enzyme)